MKIDKKNSKNRKFLVLTSILFVITISSSIFNLILISNLGNMQNNEISSDNESLDFQNTVPNTQDSYNIYHTEEWLDNPTMDLPISPWYNTSFGDTSDINATTSSGAANYELLGDTGSFSLVANPPDPSDWTSRSNPEFPAFPRYPYTAGTDDYLIDSQGFWCAHEWREDPRQTPSVQWYQEFELPVNMSDYEITSASISAIANGTVTDYVDVNPIYGDDELGDTSSNGQGVVYDFVKYYVRVADATMTDYYEIASNKTINLGAPSVLTMADTFMKTIPESTLIFYLTQALSDNWRNFTVIVGFDIFCEDSCSTDRDQFTSLYIKNVQLNFTYEKKIDQLSWSSWSQIGNKISGSNVDIENATLNFKYKVSDLWPNESPNSEFRIIINGTQHSETVKLTTATTSFQLAKTGDFDVGYLIRKDVNISLSIQLYLADDFLLNQLLIVSIDDVYLNITYRETNTEDVTSIDLFLEGTNSTLDKLIEVNKGYTVNVSVIYKDSTNGFINGASVQITGDGVSGTQSMDEQTVLGHYNYTIDTNDLDFGNNYLTVTASKFTYETRIIANFKIKVLDIQSEISKILIEGEDHTADKNYAISAGKLLNITVQYTNLTGSHIEGATLEATSTSFSRSLNESITFGQYNITLNTTSDLGVGVSFVTISAEKQNYTSESEKLTIIVWEQETYAYLFLNGINKTDDKYIQMNVNKTLNITVSYKDDLNQHIPGAQVNLTGAGIDEPLTEAFNNYTTTINTTDLNQGVNFLNIYAYKDGYDPQAIRITVEILIEQTELRLFLNGTDKTIDKTQEIDIGQDLNVTIAYNTSSTGAFIDSATVQILGGYYDGVNLTENYALEQYTIVLNSTDLNWGVNYITVYAFKNNYEAQTITFKLTIINKATELDLYLNGTKRVTEEERSITIQWNEELNVTVVYKEEVTKDFISGANVELFSGLTLLGTLQKPALIDHYNYTLNTTKLTVGIHFLTIDVNLTNYEAQTVVFRIEVINRDTEFGDVLLNTQSTTTLTIGSNETIDIVALYNDTKTNSLVYGANVELRNSTGVYGVLLKPASLEQYNLTINSGDLKLGNNYFTLVCKKGNYTTISIQITITVELRNAILGDTYLNMQNTNFLTIAWNETVDLTVTYNDTLTGLLIYNANVVLKNDTGIFASLTKHPTLELYNLTFNTMDLVIGNNYFTLECEKYRYEKYSKEIIIKVERRETYLEILLDGDDKTSDPTLEIPFGDDLEIEIIYYDNATGYLITTANVLLTGDDISELISWDPVASSYMLDTLDTKKDLIVGPNFLSVEVTKLNYESISESIKIEIRTLDLEITTKSGKSTIDARPGDNVDLIIIIENLDFGGNIKGALVSYTSDLPQGDIKEGDLEETDGEYKVTLANVPEGTWTITVTVFGDEDKGYETQRYEITLLVQRPPDEALLFQTLTGVSVAAAIGLTAYLIAYQRLLKYPKAVRKVRKFRKTLSKKKAPDMDVPKREAAFRDAYASELEAVPGLSKVPKTPKPTGKKGTPIDITPNKGPKK